MITWLLWIEERDRRVLEAVVRQRSLWVTPVMRGVTFLGEPVVATGVGFSLLSGLFLPTGGAGGEAFAALAISHLFVQILKRSVTRSRPSRPAGLTMLVQPPDRFSFPSGHAAATLSMALPVSAALPTFPGVLVLGLAFMVGLSRPYLGVHYPSDVLTGWLMGLLGASLAPGVITLLA